MKQIASLLATLCLISSSISSPFIFEWEPLVEPDYRLNRNVLPSNYAVKLTLQDDFGVNSEFDGVVDIKIKAQKAGVTEIVLHSNVVKIETVTLSGINVIDSKTDNVTNKLTITTATALSEELEYNLKITYKGLLNDDMKGFYKSSYKNQAGVDEWLATTQFQPGSAREAFPCFDEPSFKATFDITIVRPAGYATLANTKLENTTPVGPRFEDKFLRTPIMSTYLVAFIVSKFKSFAPVGSNLNVWAREEAIATGKYAYDTMQPILEAMETFAGSLYAAQNLGKLDMVAIPDFSAGAMENWGLITYRETALLWDQNESSNNYKQRVAAVIAHEIAHNWFGNLVTTHWWSDTWLNEGFARYFQYHITAQVETDWELEQQFVIEQQH